MGDGVRFDELYDEVWLRWRTAAGWSAQRIANEDWLFGCGYGRR